MKTQTTDFNWKQWLTQLHWVAVSESEFQSLSSDEKLIRIRHSSAHLLAQAIQKLYPDVLLATGPATSNGFFYDFQFFSSFTTQDIDPVQSEMSRAIQEKQTFFWTSVPKEKAIQFFQFLGQKLKVEIIYKLNKNDLTLYRNGDFVDLCAGPHVPNTNWCQATQILSFSSAHWKKDEKIPSLTRIYGTAWQYPKELKQYLQLVAEIKKRDHRDLGPKLDLFSFHPWAASALWHPKGLVLREELMKLWKKLIRSQQYVEILNPLLYQKELFQCSGHWEYFKENMFIFSEEKTQPSFVLKPMNCPDTMLFYKTKTRSYRDLPFRVAEGQFLHRKEVTGALHGIMRTRTFVQDDGHIFLTSEQIQEEVKLILSQFEIFSSIFGLKYEAHLSTRPAKHLGAPETWEIAEKALQYALQQSHLSFQVDSGEGAFYGPKIDIIISDNLGRQWQCSTIQLDFQLPERFDLHYSAENGSLQRPIVIHRAIFGSLERFIGILIEHFGGAFPTWLSPVQVVLIPIHQGHLEYAKKIFYTLTEEEIRVEIWSKESVSNRVRITQNLKIPYTLVLGDQEQSSNILTVRKYGSQDHGTISVSEFVSELKKNIQSRKLDVPIKNYVDHFSSKKNISTENLPY